MEFSDQQTELRDRLTILYTSTFITTTMIKRWLNMAKDWACSYKPWPFLATKNATDLIDATGEYPYPTGFRTYSIFLIRVDGKRYIKINYEDYLKYLEEYPTGTDKVWAQYDRDIFINGNACSVGDTIGMYGKGPVADLSADDDETPFADGEPDGDEAIILKAESIVVGSKLVGRQNDSLKKLAEASAILDKIWDRIEEQKPKEVRKARPMFKKINVLKGSTSEITRNNIGRF